MNVPKVVNLGGASFKGRMQVLDNLNLKISQTYKNLMGGFNKPWLNSLNQSPLAVFSKFNERFINLCRENIFSKVSDDKLVIKIAPAVIRENLDAFSRGLEIRLEDPKWNAAVLISKIVNSEQTLKDTIAVAKLMERIKEIPDWGIFPPRKTAQEMYELLTPQGRIILEPLKVGNFVLYQQETDFILNLEGGRIKVFSNPENDVVKNFQAGMECFLGLFSEEDERMALIKYLSQATPSSFLRKRLEELDYDLSKILARIREKTGVHRFRMLPVEDLRDSGLDEFTAVLS
jgi:hypothetical protein